MTTQYFLILAIISPYIACFLLGHYVKHMHRIQAKYFYDHWKAYVGHANLPPEPIRGNTFPAKKKKAKVFNPRNNIEEKLKGNTQDIFD